MAVVVLSFSLTSGLSFEGDAVVAPDADSLELLRLRVSLASRALGAGLDEAGRRGVAAAGGGFERASSACLDCVLELQGEEIGKDAVSQDEHGKSNRN